MSNGVWTKEDEENLQRTTSDYNALTSRKKQIEAASFSALGKVAAKVAENFRLHFDPAEDAPEDEPVRMAEALRDNAISLAVALKPYVETQS